MMSAHMGNTRGLGDGTTGDVPACGYVEGVLRLAALGLVPAGQLSHLTVVHDDWCPVLGGAGTKRCEPEFFLDGEQVTLA